MIIQTLSYPAFGIHVVASYKNYKTDWLIIPNTASHL